MAPAFAACVADFDGDANEDLFISQNFFALQPDTPRCDAGVGLWLRGDGRGGFAAVNAQESGVRVYGEQRGAAAADFDGDGRVDLAVTQNGAETKLFRNARAKPGLRVRLKGPPGNSDGVGVAIRVLDSAGRGGPTREVHAGSGYWSQDGAVQVMAAVLPAKLWTRWPGGRTNTVDIPVGVREVTIGPAGLVGAEKSKPGDQDGRQP